MLTQKQLEQAAIIYRCISFDEKKLTLDGQRLTGIRVAIKNKQTLCSEEVCAFDPWNDNGLSEKPCLDYSFIAINPLLGFFEYTTTPLKQGEYKSAPDWNELSSQQLQIVFNQL